MPTLLKKCPCTRRDESQSKKMLNCSRSRICRLTSKITKFKTFFFIILKTYLEYLLFFYINLKLPQKDETKSKTVCLANDIISSYLSVFLISVFLHVLRTVKKPVVYKHKKKINKNMALDDINIVSYRSCRFVSFF